MKLVKQKTSAQRLAHIIPTTLGICLGIMCLFLFIFSVWFNSKSNYCSTTANDIGYMQSVVSEIKNNISKYTLSTKEIMSKSTEGGQQTDYTFNGILVLKKQTFFGETGKAEIDYYFKNSKVFYINEKNTQYILPISEDSSGNVKKIDTKEFYIDIKQNLCVWYLNKQIQTNDAETESLIKNVIINL